MNYYIETWGCQMNDRDSNVMAGLLEDAGYEHVDDEEEAQVIVLNTCCVREKAEEKVFGRLGQFKVLKKKNEGLLIAIGGCMTQQEAIQKRIRSRYPQVDIIFGTHNLHRLPQLIEQARRSSRPVTEVWAREGEVVEGLPSSFAFRARALVNVSYGCDNFCTYCIVPYVRGRERSREPEAILAEVRKAAGQGIKEIMLLGQNVNSYGRGLDGEVDFSDLLEMVQGVEGIERIRFMTSHPRDFPPKLVATLGSLSKVCEHVHLPVQAGSNGILKRMGRRYTRERYLDLVSELRAAIPGLSLTTDIIAGFPGETEKDFEDTLDLVRQVRFDNAFTFIYSPREGTPAAKIADQIPLGEKKRRLQELMELQNSISLEINRQLVGSCQEVLVEGPARRKEGFVFGHTRGNKVMIFPGEKHFKGRVVATRVEEAQTWTLFGKPTTEEQGEEGYRAGYRESS